MNQTWTDEERTVIAEIYRAGRPLPYHLLPNRTPAAIRGEAQKCGLVKETRTKWEAADVCLLEQAYATWPPNYDLLPGRTRATIQTQAHLRGLTNRKLMSGQYPQVVECDWAYFAGLIEGEGTIWLQPTRTPRRFRPMVKFHNTDQGLVEWVQATFPCYSRTDVAPTPVGKYQPVKPLAVLSWQRREVVRELLTHMLPYFRGYRRERAETALLYLAETKKVT